MLAEDYENIEALNVHNETVPYELKNWILMKMALGVDVNPSRRNTTDASAKRKAKKFGGVQSSSSSESESDGDGDLIGGGRKVNMINSQPGPILKKKLSLIEEET